jgi:hypothetical protein
VCSSDLNYRGALQKGFTSFNNLKGANLALLARAETRDALIKGILTGKNPFSGVNIPNIGNLGRSSGSPVTDGIDWAKNKFNIGRNNTGLQSNNTNQDSLKNAGVAFGRTPPPIYNNDPGRTGVVSNGSGIGGSNNYGYVPTISYNGLPLDQSPDIRSAVGGTQTSQTVPYSIRPMNYPTTIPSNQGSTQNGVGAFGKNPNI